MFDFLSYKKHGHEKPLGAKFPDERPYLQKYRLTAATMPSTETPVVLGIPWYSTFDSPERDLLTGRWWIGRKKNIGFMRGGHAICLKPYNLNDKTRWWKFYDQGNEGSCVGFALSRAMSMMNVETYDGFWLYQEAQFIDEWEETPPKEGTSVNAGCQILKTMGHKRVVIKDGHSIIQFPDFTRGITAYRWAESIDDIHKALKNPVADKLGALPFLNSWGLFYPHITWMPDEVAHRIIFEEYGEAMVLVDR